MLDIEYDLSSDEEECGGNEEDEDKCEDDSYWWDNIDAQDSNEIELFLHAVDNNTSCPELQVRLPDPKNVEELNNLAQKWSNASTVYRLVDGFLGALDGWLPRTEMPRGVTNQADYFSE